MTTSFPSSPEPNSMTFFLHLSTDGFGFDKLNPVSLDFACFPHCLPIHGVRPKRASSGFVH